MSVCQLQQRQNCCRKLSRYPCDQSWGYQCAAGLYAVDRRLGTPDDFRFLVDTLRLGLDRRRPKNGNLRLNAKSMGTSDNFITCIQTQGVSSTIFYPRLRMNACCKWCAMTGGILMTEAQQRHRRLHGLRERPLRQGRMGFGEVQRPSTVRVRRQSWRDPWLGNGSLQLLQSRSSSLSFGCLGCTSFSADFIVWILGMLCMLQPSLATDLVEEGDTVCPVCLVVYYLFTQTII